MYQPFNQPLSIFKALGSSISFYKESFVRLLPLNIAFILFSIVSSQLVSVINIEKNNFSIKAFSFFFAVNAILYLIYLMMIKMGQQIMLQKPLNYREAFKISMSKWFFCFSGKIVFTVAVIAGMMLLLFPGIYVFFTLSFVTLSILFSEESLMEEIRQSIRVISDHWWRVVSLLGIVLILMIGLLSLWEEILMPDVDLVFFWKELAKSFQIVYEHWFLITLGIVLATMSSISLTKAIKQSTQLVAHHWWETFILLGIFVWTLFIGLSFLAITFYRSEFLLNALTNPMGRTAVMLTAQSLVTFITIPWMVAVYLTQYHNLTLKQKEVTQSSLTGTAS